MDNQLLPRLNLHSIRDPIARRQAPLLLLLLLVLIAASLARLLLFLGTDRASIGALPAIAITLIQLAGPTIALVLLLRGYFSAAVLLVAFALLLTIVIAIVATGLRHSGMLPLVFALPIVLAGLLIGWRGLALVVGASCAVVIGIAMLESTGSPLVGFAPSPEQPASMASIFVFVAVLLFILLSRFHHNYRRELAEHYRTESTLRQSEMHFAAVFRASPAAMSIVRLRDGMFIDLNTSYERLFGYGRDELIGQPRAELTISPGSEPQPALAQRLREGGSIHNQELTLHTKSGEARDVLCSLETLELQGEPCLLALFFDITERKRGELQHAETKQKLSTILDLLPVGVAILDADRTVSYMNPALERILELPQASLLSGAHQKRTYLQHDGTPMPSSAFASAQVLREGRAVSDIETGIVKEDGKLIWTSVSAVPVAFPDWSVVTVTVDITKRKQTEAALRASEERFATAFHASPAALMLTKLDDGRILDVNESYCRMLGYHKDEMIGRTTLELNIYTEPSVRASLIDTIRGQRSLRDFEVTVRTKSGVLREALWSIDVLETEGGQCILTTATDITDRKQAEQARERTAQRLQVLADASRVFAEVGGGYQVEAVLERIAQATVAALGEGCAITLISDDRQWMQAAVLYDVDPEQHKLLDSILGYAPYPVTEPSLTARIFQSGQALLLPIVDPSMVQATTQPASLIHRLAVHSLLGVPMRVQGQTIGVLILYRRRPDQPPFDQNDLSLAQDLAERAALSINSAHLFQQAQAELAERKQAEAALAQQTEDLQRSNAELEQFAYVASHDLQEPLRAVAGMVQLLQQRYGGQLDARADQYISHAVEGATRMQALINELLVFSRVGTRTKAFTPTSVADALRAALANLGVAIAESGASIAYDSLPTVQADASQLTQLFQNLIGNAIKFHSDQPPVIQIGAERQANAWCITVRDNGIGIAPDYFERIFVVFQRLHTRRSYPGTGIGLALCKKIVQRHGGRIWVESKPGEGATFFFTLPDRSDANAR